MNAIWNPTQGLIETTRLYQWMTSLGFQHFDNFLKASTQDINWFWGEAEKALGIEWFKPYDHVLDLSKGVKWPNWYVGGQLNAVHNALDKWANHPLKRHQTALIWEGENESVKHYTFAELSSEVANFAEGLSKIGLCKGDRVGIYMPMIPETVIAILAVSRIGAIFTPSFSGYAADAVSKRLNASKAKMLITADGFYRRGKIVPMKEEADKACITCPSIEKKIIVRHLGREISLSEDRDLDWNSLKGETSKHLALPMDSSDPCMLLYTSGTTGNPKGIVHTHSGFPLKAAFDAAFGMDLKERDTLFWVTDMGWMMGPFLVFGALLNGAAAVLYEGVVDYPKTDRLWKLVEKHHVTHLGISPTLVRMFMKEGTESIEKYDMSSLRIIASTGEPWNPEPWMWLFKNVCKYKIPIINYSGGTEISGGILGNILLKPITPASFNSPLPGMDIDVFDENGQSLFNAVGELVIKQPWVGMAQGFWQESERYVKTFWDRWTDIWVHSDWAVVDGDGFWKIIGRSDDTLKIAGKRVGPVEIESILVEDKRILEAGAIGVPDPIKGESAVCFVVLKNEDDASLELQEFLLDSVAFKLGKALRPSWIYFVKALPKTRNGKMMRRVIRAAYLDLKIDDLSALENLDAVESIRYMEKGNATCLK
jgi:acetyl-CoA synthetase